MSSIVPIPAYTTPASPVVVEQINRLNDNADDLLVQVDAAIDDLQELSFSNVDIDPRFQWSEDDLQSLLDQLGGIPGFDPLEDWLNDFDLSAGNEDFVYNPLLAQRLAEQFPEFIIPDVPAAPPVPEAPADPGEQPDVPRPVRPVLDNYPPPEVDLSEPAPEYIDYTAEVPFPELRPIELPEVPELALDEIQFEGQAPVFMGTDPDPADFVFNPEIYDPLYIDELSSVVSSMLQGGTGLPPEVENALYERAREREMETSAREVEQLNEEWASRGYMMPPGALSRRTDRSRKEASDKVSQLNRDQMIEFWRIQIEQLRTALSTAIALEEIWFRQYSDSENRRLQALQLKMEVTLGIYNAYIARYNADANVFQVQAQVYRDRIQAEQAKVAVYAEQLRAAQIIGELNALDVRIFAERIQALQVNAEIYRTRVQAWSETFRAIEVQVQIYRAQLESNKLKVDTYVADTRAFSELVRAQLVREERFNIKANMYTKQIDAWRTQYEGVLAGHNADVEKVRLQLGAYDSNTQRLTAFAQSESNRIQALVQKYQAIVAEIQAKSESEQTKYQLMLAIAQQAIERMKAAADILLKNGEINIQSGLTAANLMLRAKETAATTLAQLAAGMTSAASVNAGISDSSSSSVSYNFNGELEIN